MKNGIICSALNKWARTIPYFFVGVLFEIPRLARKLLPLVWRYSRGLSIQELVYIASIRYRQPEKWSEYQTLVLNDRPIDNVLAVSFCRRWARLRLCAYDFHCSIQKRTGKLGRNVSFHGCHVLCMWHSLCQFQKGSFAQFGIIYNFNLGSSKLGLRP